MAEGNSLTSTEYQELWVRLEELADESRALLLFDEAENYSQAAEAVRSWLEGTGKRPNAVLKEFAGLVTALESPAEQGLPSSAPAHIPEEPLDAQLGPTAPPEAESQQVEPAPTPISIPERETIAPATQPDLEYGLSSVNELRRADTMVEMGFAGDAGMLRQGVALSGSLRDQPDVADEARELHARAQTELNRRLQIALDEGDSARRGQDESEARLQYGLALEFDPSNSHARNALLELDRAVSDRLGQSEIAELRRGLKSRRDLRELGDAVYKAEFLDAENKLTDELVELLEQAREAYDKARREQGATTTLMRTGDMKARKTARDEFEEMVARGDRVIFDVTTNTMRPAVEVLEEANVLYRQGSEDTANYEIKRVNQALPHFPAGALKRLEAAIEQPFQEEHRRILEQKRDEIEGLLEAERNAELLLRQEGETSDPVEVLRLALQAHNVFPYLAGLDEKLIQSRRTAAEVLAAQIRDLFDRARALIPKRDFQGARALLAEAEALPAKWPEEERPEPLLLLAADGRELREQIKQEEQTLDEFNNVAAQIRDHVTSPGMREVGLAILRQVDAEARFAALPEYTALRNEMDQYRDISDLLDEVRLANTRGDWERLFTLTAEVERTGKAGRFGRENRALHKVADTELKIAEAKQAISDLDFAAADRILEKLLRDSEENAEDLRRRLDDELAQIEAARQAEPMAILFRRARDFANDPGELRKLDALKMLNYIGGDQSAYHQDGWPVFSLSFHTAAARREAAELREELRKQLLPDICRAYEQRETEPHPLAERLATLADRAKHLRDARLLDDESERNAAAWLILHQGKLDAEAKQSSGEWETAVEYWQALEDSYPRTVGKELRAARIQLALFRADRYLREGDSQHATEVLQAAQNEPGMAQSHEILLKLAEINASRGRFEDAFDNVERAARLPEDGIRAQADEKRLWLIREREIYDTLREAQVEKDNGDGKEALRILTAALAEPLGRDSRRLLRERDQLFNRMVSDLRRLAAERQKGGTVEGKVEAVVALVDMRELEDLVGTPEENRRSDKELEPLRDELRPGAESVEYSAQEFDPVAQPLEEGIRQATELVGRLQTFGRVIPLIGSDMAGLQEALIDTQKQLGETLDRLRELKVVLAEAGSDDLWRDALVRDNFNELEQYRGRIRRLGLSQMVDVIEFETRLDEWKTVHDYLLRAIAMISDAFSREEKFNLVREMLREVTVRPQGRPDNASRWSQVQQSDYDGIRQVMQHKLIIEDITEGRVVGWTPVDQLAEQRQLELDVWQTWQRDYERLMADATTARDIAKGSDGSAPRVERRAHWQKVIDNAQTALELLVSGPLLAGQSVPAFSRSAREISEQAKHDEVSVRNFLSDAQAAQPQAKPFPSQQEFAMAARSMTLLENILTTANEIGAENEDEQRRIDYYQKRLTKLKRDVNVPWWRRLFGR